MDLPNNCILSRPSEWAKKEKFLVQTGKISIWLIAFQIQPGQMVPIGFMLQVEPTFSHNKTARQKLAQDRLKYLRPKPFIPAAVLSWAFLINSGLQTPWVGPIGYSAFTPFVSRTSLRCRAIPVRPLSLFLLSSRLASKSKMLNS